MKVYDLDTFILVIMDDENARTIGRLHPNYEHWKQKINQPKQLGLDLGSRDEQEAMLRDIQERVRLRAAE